MKKKYVFIMRISYIVILSKYKNLNCKMNEVLKFIWNRNYGQYNSK